ncbi:hypothetical protein SAMN03159496_06352 [Rhizobium sp. NFR07]|nr:hypothetical protein SAMN03159496_06352 [Rhizobium sp. NFR07]
MRSSEIAKIAGVTVRTSGIITRSVFLQNRRVRPIDGRQRAVLFGHVFND